MGHLLTVEPQRSGNILPVEFSPQARPQAKNSSGRVTSERIGRDLNPMGRGRGQALVAGAFNLGRIAPALPISIGGRGSGNSVNNLGVQGGGGGGGGGGW